MKGFAKFIAKLPLMGKLTIRPLVFGVYQSTNTTERANRYLWFMVVLVLYLLLHAVQAIIGINALGFNSPVWVKVICALYAFINACVVLAQFYLGYRVTRFNLGNTYPRTERSYDDHSDTEVLIMKIVTIGGQTVFLSLFFWYR